MSTISSNVITLRGSTDIVVEFFNFSVNNILYQRGFVLLCLFFPLLKMSKHFEGIYPPESFKRVSQYGLSMMITTDEGLLSYLSNILRQLDGEFLIKYVHDTKKCNNL